MLMPGKTSSQQVAMPSSSFLALVELNSVYFGFLTFTFISERTLEDHEVVIKVYKSWGSNSSNKLCLVNNDKKFEFLESPEVNDLL